MTVQTKDCDMLATEHFGLKKKVMSMNLICSDKTQFVI